MYVYDKFKEFYFYFDLKRFVCCFKCFILCLVIEIWVRLRDVFVSIRFVLCDS